MPKVGASKRPCPREGRNLLSIGVDAETYPRSTFNGFAGGSYEYRLERLLALDARYNCMHFGPTEG
jgi:hypothetical protein